MINIIVAFTSKRFGIGLNGALPWNIKEDLVHFQKLTRDSVVVMGRRTWESIPVDRRPLKNRINVVVTSDPSKYNVPGSGVVFLLEQELDGFLASRQEPIFIIGGSFLYERYVGKADRVYSTILEKDFECDTHFPTDRFGEYEISEYSPQFFSDVESCHYRFVTYSKKVNKHGEYAYLDTMAQVLAEGSVRTDRTGTGTWSIFAPQMRFDISNSFPLLTTKFVGYKSVIRELLFFIRGQTNSKVLEQQGVNIWKANTTRDFLDKRGLSHYSEGDMGPMYGFNWRHFGAKYMGPAGDYTLNNAGHDQLANLIHTLKTDPFSRRHLMTTYDPSSLQKSVLAPCHGIVAQFYVDEVDNVKYLSCHMYQRSMDTFLGATWNIASYSALTYIIAKICDMRPKELVISTGDCHVYKNHYDQAMLQLSRTPLPFPILQVSDSIKSKPIEEIGIDDFTLVGYLHYPAIKADMAV